MPYLNFEAYISQLKLKLCHLFTYPEKEYNTKLQKMFWKSLNKIKFYFRIQ